LCLWMWNDAFRKEAEMNEILCNHRWTLYNVGYDGCGIGDKPVTPFRKCNQCEAVWYDGDNEPESVIGRIREG
jgi:hypothetical protein